MPDEPATPRHFPVKAAILEGGLVLVALVVGAVLGVNPMRTLKSSPAAIGWGMVGALPPLVALAVLLQVPWRPIRRLVEVVDESLVPLFGQCGLAELGIIALLAGLGEEMLFRGAIQQAAAGAIGGPHGPWLGLAAASALFGMAHFITPLYAILAALMGAYLGGLWLWSGNLVVPVATHAVYDFAALVYLVKIHPSQAARSADDQPPTSDS